MSQTNTLAGRTALVTGSTQGIGRAIAIAMSNAGAHVIHHGLEVSPDSAGELFITGDLLKMDTPGQLMQEAFSLAPELDILVCNAGSFFDVPFLDMTPELWEKTQGLNLRAPYFLVQEFARKLAEKERSGSVLLMASTNGLQAEENSTAYDSCKGAVVMMTRTLALNLAKYGIRVNCLAPGLIRTPLTERWLDANVAARSHYEKSVPLGRIGLPEDCAGAAVFLASQGAAYITGQVMVIDGGLTSAQISPL